MPKRLGSAVLSRPLLQSCLMGPPHNLNIAYLARSWIHLSSVWGFTDSSVGKEYACNVGDLGLIPGLGRSPGEGKSYPLQYSGLENSVDCVVNGVTKSQTWLSDFHFQVQFSNAWSHRSDPELEMNDYRKVFFLFRYSINVCYTGFWRHVLNSSKLPWSQGQGVSALPVFPCCCCCC